MNANVKGDGGAVGLTQNESALRRWVIAGPKVARVINEFKSSLPSMQTLDTRHHEEQSSVQLSHCAKCFTAGEYTSRNGQSIPGSG